MFTKLPFKKRFGLLRKLFKPALFPEAYFAYFHKLPSQITVSWFRDSGMIVGKVQAGGLEFMTQGKDAADFIRMVNESVVIAFNIPDDYFDIINRTKTYTPPPAALKMLDDMSVPRQSFGLVKDELVFKTA
jgi:hypothetical protein